MLSMHTILLTLIIVPTIYVCHSLILLYRSYHHFSRTLPIPLIAVPIEPSTIAAQTFLPILFSITDRFISRSNYPIWIVPLRAGWQHVDATSTRIFSRGSWWYGKGDDRPLPAIGVISPAGLNVHICDPNAIVQMLEARDRGNGYGVARDPAMYSVLALYGPCLSTAENQDWPRHRKALAPPFNESVMAEVWDETRAQARGLVNAWSGAGHDGVACLATDLRTLALNVLAAVGFRKSTTFVSAVEKGEQDILIREAMTFRDALAAVLDNALLLLVIPMRLLVWPVWPKRMQMLGKVGMQLKQHMDKMLDDELASADRGDKSSGGIMSALLNALRTNLEQNKASAGATGSLAQGLTKEECCGNIFIVNFAGHDTTANTLAFAALQLIANPKVQDWLREEITHVASAKDGSSNDYRAIYPKLKRCQAVLLETLRLYPAVWSIPRRVSQQPFKLNLSFGLDEEQEVILPPKAYVGACVASVQMQTTIWGSDAESWRPSRWIDVDEESTAIGNEKLIEPVKGSFGAWSHGPQNCLGQKFSLVEFVAVLVELLANYNLEAVPKPQESPGQTQERVMSILRDIEVLMLVKLRRGDAVRVRLREVE